MGTMVKPQAEDVVEELALLQALAQSPGWARYSSRLRRRVQSSDKEKAVLLRNQEGQGAMFLQAKIDGMNFALDYLAQLIDERNASVSQAVSSPYP